MMEVTVRRRLLLLLLSIPLLLLLVVAAFYLHDLIVGANAPYRRQAAPHPEYPELGSEWVMHPIDNPGDWLPNGLDAADVNGDGQLDYVTNYEFRGRVRVALHPGDALGDGFWPAVDVGRFPNAESSAMGDLDGDGWYDVVVAHGVEHTTALPGIRVLWGQSGPSWADGGDLPASQGGWQFLYVKTVDLDGDGDTDVLAGGRANRVASDANRESQDEALVWAGLRWFRNPRSEGGDARDLAAYALCTVDPEIKSGHGFVWGDVDGDGDLDLAVNNADWDTPDAEEQTVWYENPGPARACEPWSLHLLHCGREFYGKEQVAIVDIDGDGDADILNHTERHVYAFRNQGGEPPAFEMHAIEKHPAAQWRARPLAVADLNGDGQLDLIGALIHRDGRLPKAKAAVFWMEQGADGWTTHAIKWGDGFWGLGTFNGEKWDQLWPVDVDGDGDLDVVANVEEYNRLRTILAVVWFENPLME